MGTVGKALVALIGVAGCLAAVAYAASVHAVRRQGLTSPADAHRLTEPGHLQGVSSLDAIGGRGDGTFGAMAIGIGPARPRLASHPARPSLSTTARFRLRRPGRRVRLRCRLDRRRWRPCGPRVVYRGLARGRHRFRVRAIDGRGRRSAITRFAWTIATPVEFSIAAGPSPLGPLYPGAPPTQVPVLLTNPNPQPIYVTSVSVEVTSGPPGCEAATNLALVPSGASEAAPLPIPAHASVGLPAPGVSAPAIQLLDLPVDQDACRGASFSLAFHGSARG